MVFDVSGGSEQAILDMFIACVARRKPLPCDASYLVFLCVDIVVENVVNTGLRNYAAYPVVHERCLRFEQLHDSRWPCCLFPARFSCIFDLVACSFLTDRDDMHATFLKFL